jgi:hypothetical protein
MASPEKRYTGGVRHEGDGRSEHRGSSRRGEVAPALAWVLRLETLEEVLRRGLELVDVIVQDEYTHDVVTRSGEAYVVFDTT